MAIRLRRYLQGDAEAVKGGFSHHFYKTQPITRERFDELAALRLENTGKVSGAFEIDLDAGWCSALNLADLQKQGCIYGRLPRQPNSQPPEKRTMAQTCRLSVRPEY